MANGQNPFLEALEGRALPPENPFLSVVPSATTQEVRTVVAPPALDTSQPKVATIDVSPAGRGMRAGANPLVMAREIAEFAGFSQLFRVAVAGTGPAGQQASANLPAGIPVKPSEPLLTSEQATGLSEFVTGKDLQPEDVQTAALVLAAPAAFRVGGKIAAPLLRPVRKVVGKALDAVGTWLTRTPRPVLREGVERAVNLADDAARGGDGVTGMNLANIEAAETAAGQAPVLDPRRVQSAVQTVIEGIRAGEVAGDDLLRKDSRRLFQQLADAFQVGEIHAGQIPEIIAKYGLTPEEAAVFWTRMFKRSVSEGAKAMQKLSVLEKELAKVAPPEIMQQLFGRAKVQDDLWSRLLGWRRNVYNTWRASITAQLGTATRNSEVSAIRVGLQGFDELLAGVVLKVTGHSKLLNGTSRQAARENLMAVFRRLSPKARERTSKLLSHMPEEQMRLVGTPLSDVKITNKYIRLIQIFNRTQAREVRHAGFDAMFSVRLMRLGVDPYVVMNEGLSGLDPVMRGAVKRAYREAGDHALDIGFDLTRNPRTGQVWSPVSWYTRVPELVFVHPFPRYFSNALSFLYEHSPLGPIGAMLRASFGKATLQAGEQLGTGFVGRVGVASRARLGQAVSDIGIQQSEGLAKETARQMLDIVAGEATEEGAKVFARALDGAMMFGAGLALRNSDLAGEKWYEVRVGGRVIDIRPFGPINAYVFLAELASNPEKVQGKDFFEAFLGIRRLTGTALFLVDRAYNWKEFTTFQREITRFAADIASGFTVPLRTVKALLATVKPDEGIAREGEALGPFGRMLENVPVASTELLPPAFRPTRPEPYGEEPRRLVEPLRQLTGLGLGTETAAEAEIKRLDLQQQAFPSTGDRTLDNLLRQEMGQRSELLNKVVAGDRYQKATDRQKEEILSSTLSRLKATAKSVVLRERRAEIVSGLAEELRGETPDRQREKLDKLRGRGQIDGAIQREVLRRLR